MAEPARQPIHASMVTEMAAAIVSIAIAVGTGWTVIGAARRIGERTEVVVEGVVLLHHDDDVLDLAQVAVSVGRGRRQHRGEKSCRTFPRLPHVTPSLRSKEAGHWRAAMAVLLHGGDIQAPRPRANSVAHEGPSPE